MFDSSSTIKTFFLPSAVAWPYLMANMSSACITFRKGDYDRFQEGDRLVVCVPDDWGKLPGWFPMGIGDVVDSDPREDVFTVRFLYVWDHQQHIAIEVDQKELRPEDIDRLNVFMRNSGNVFQFPANGLPLVLPQKGLADGAGTLRQQFLEPVQQAIADLPVAFAGIVAPQPNQEGFYLTERPVSRLVTPEKPEVRLALADHLERFAADLRDKDFRPVQWTGQEVDLAGFENLLWLYTIPVPTDVAGPDGIGGGPGEGKLLFCHDPHSQQVVWMTFTHYGIVQERALFDKDDTQKVAKHLERPYGLNREKALDLLKLLHDGKLEDTNLKLDLTTMQIHAWFHCSNTGDELLMESYQLEPVDNPQFDQALHALHANFRTAPEDALHLTESMARWMMAVHSRDTRIHFQNGFWHADTARGRAVLSVKKPEEEGRKGKVLDFGIGDLLVISSHYPKTDVIDLILQPGRGHIAHKPEVYQALIASGTLEVEDQIVLRFHGPESFLVLPTQFSDALLKLAAEQPVMEPEEMAVLRRTRDASEIIRLRALCAKQATEIAQLKEGSA